MDKLTHENRKRLYLRILLRAILFVVCILLLIFVVPRLFSLFAPFIFAFLMALILNPLVSKLNEKFGFSRKLTALILVILVFTGFAALIGKFIYTIINEMVTLANNFQSVWDSAASALDFINTKLEWFLGFLPSEAEITLANIIDNLYQSLQSASGDFLNFILSQTTSITTTFSNSVVNVIVFIIAAYFITAEYYTMGSLVKKHLGSRMYRYFDILKNASKSALGRYLRAQLLLALLAFVVMFPALQIYGQAYAFLIALFLAFIDFLPIVGTAVVLIPWGILEMAGGNTIKALFLIILAVAFFILRKIVEPKIVGSQTDLHPLIALMSIFVGLKISGIWGAVLGPIAVMIAINIVKTHVFDNAVKDIKDVFNDLADMLQR